MPPRIMEAFSKESTQPRPASQWYPITPIPSAIKISSMATTV